MRHVNAPPTSKRFIRDAVKGGTLKAEAGVYNLASGKVTMSR